jgi:hypothetical protein
LTRFPESLNLGVNNRINWFLATQGFLFASICVLISSELNPFTKLLSIEAIAGLGSSIGFLIYSGVRGATIALNDLKDRWIHLESELPDKYLFAPPCGDDRACKLGSMPRKYIPFLIMVSWLIIAVSVWLSYKYWPAYLETVGKVQQIIVHGGG